jgi:16S rRNA (adenine1518-N6/adenine1519-N6)-dimethyltransferase
VTRLPRAPRRELGQHFLVDENILGVIGRLAALGPDDVVLEIGPGTGILTRYLADNVASVHAIEIDRSLEPALRAALGARTNVTVLFADALAVELERLEPAPTKLVANLPYAIAAPLVVESLDRLPTVGRWCVMVQREVADRLVAREGTKSYGAITVLVRLTAERVGFHPVARTCFQPQPNVDSALVALRRTRIWGDEYAWLERVVHAAFAHRRKMLVNSLELAGVTDRRSAGAALERMGRRATVRAEALAPEEFLALAEALA